MKKLVCGLAMAGLCWVGKWAWQNHLSPALGQRAVAERSVTEGQGLNRPAIGSQNGASPAANHSGGRTNHDHKTADLIDLARRLQSALNKFEDHKPLND